MSRSSDNRARWQNPDAYLPSWADRSEIIASLVEGKVLDLGAGSQALRQFVTDYTPADFHAFTPDTILIDLDSDFDTSLVSGYDFVVMAGVLEHLAEPETALEKVLSVADRVVLTYMDPKLHPYHAAFLMKLSDLYQLIDRTHDITATAHWKGQQIWRLERHAR